MPKQPSAPGDCSDESNLPPVPEQAYDLREDDELDDLEEIFLANLNENAFEQVVYDRQKDEK